MSCTLGPPLFGPSPFKLPPFSAPPFGAPTPLGPFSLSWYLCLVPCFFFVSFVIFSFVPNVFLSRVSFLCCPTCRFFCPVCVFLSPMHVFFCPGTRRVLHAGPCAQRSAVCSTRKNKERVSQTCVEKMEKRPNKDKHPHPRSDVLYTFRVSPVDFGGRLTTFAWIPLERFSPMKFCPRACLRRYFLFNTPRPGW